MKPHEERVVQEKIELDDKITKLTAFTLSSNFCNVDIIDAKLLIEQKEAMQRYSSILGRRIARFSKSDGK